MSNLLLSRAVHRHAPLTREGLLERLFTASFQGLVYTQVWEDPVVDLEAMELEPSHHVVQIASAGCNVLNYLADAEPASIAAVDLNPAHLALTRLKLAAARHLPSYESFFQLFGVGRGEENREAYALLRPVLDGATLEHWDHPMPGGRQRIDCFVDGLYQRGLLGRFIGGLHALARLQGVDPRELLKASSLREQAHFYDTRLGALLDRPPLRTLCNLPGLTFGLGVPPAQLERLRQDGDGELATVFRQRLRRLACDYPIQENYFAWQAFGRGYDRTVRRAVPPYLQRENLERVRARLDRVSTHHGSVTDYLAGQPPRSIDRYVLLDAQDWMSTAQMTALWREIGRTARPGGRVIFRTIARQSPLETALPYHLLGGWRSDPTRGAALLARDRTGVYGGFHLYVAA